jgi:pimeloyl-ACP methyl ester carboxylesterase
MADTSTEPLIRYAKSGDINLAYMVVGGGDLDVVMVPGFISHLEIGGENPRIQHLGGRLASFSRLLLFDKRGMGLSDPVPSAPPLQERMDDIRAVMDAAGFERAAILGFSEGAPLAILFAATYPDRVKALVLYGAMARTTWAPDYPIGSTKEALIESGRELVMPYWGTGATLDAFAPSAADDPAMVRWVARYERFAASPKMLEQMFDMFYDTDVREILPTVNVPTLVIHRTGDRVVNVRAGRYLAEHIAGAKYVELPGPDHALWAGDSDAIIDEIQEFLTGVRAEPEIDRVLATVMFTDIASSTEHAAQMGDRRWRELLDEHDAIVIRLVDQYKGRYIKHTGDGCLATFDGPGRAVQCASAIRTSVQRLAIDVRAGLHAGEVELRGDDVGGIAVHIGARVCALADAGEILVSRTVKDLVIGSGLAFADRGEHELKGVPGEWQIYALSA